MFYAFIFVSITSAVIILLFVDNFLVNTQVLYLRTHIVSYIIVSVGGKLLESTPIESFSRKTLVRRGRMTKPAVPQKTLISPEP